MVVSRLEEVLRTIVVDTAGGRSVASSVMG